MLPHSAPSGCWLLALWNALPGVEKPKKVGDRDALIDQLWSAIEMLPDPEPQPDPKRRSKLSILRGTEGPSRSSRESIAKLFEPEKFGRAINLFSG